MADLVIFPDTDTLARKIAIQGLAERGLSGIKVGSKIPASMPARFIRLYTIPGKEICVRTMWCQVVAFVYDDAANEVRCSETARLLGAILRAAPEAVIDGNQQVTVPCELHGPYPSQDPDLPNVPRYQVNVTWTIQSTVI